MISLAQVTEALTKLRATAENIDKASTAVQSLCGQVEQLIAAAGGVEALSARLAAMTKLFGGK